MSEFAGDVGELLAGYRRFRAGRYLEQAALFRSLRDGQTPATMVLACADSRADPSLIFDASPGELFVVRNVAALAPPYDEAPGLHGVSAALEFAITVLKVRQILVMGHGGCGGVAASLSAAADRPVGRFIAPWVELISTARDRVLGDSILASPPQRQEALERAAVNQSIVNLRTFPFIQEAVEARGLTLAGAWFSIGRGELHWRDPESGRFFLVPPEPGAAVAEPSAS